MDEAATMLARQRSQGYWFAAELFLRRPDAAFLGELQAQLAAADPAALAGSPALGELRAALLGPATAAELAQTLGVEYTRLLRGIREGYGPPPPYESLYREQRLVGEVTLAVLRHYRQAGYGVIEADLGPQDHIAAELRFMALLAHDEAEARQQGRREAALAAHTQQAGFFHRHLLAWVPGHLDVLQGEAREAFYAAAARLVAELIAADRDLLPPPTA